MRSRSLSVKIRHETMPLIIHIVGRLIIELLLQFLQTLQGAADSVGIIFEFVVNGVSTHLLNGITIDAFQCLQCLLYLTRRLGASGGAEVFQIVLDPRLSFVKLLEPFTTRLQLLVGTPLRSLCGDVVCNKLWLI